MYRIGNERFDVAWGGAMLMVDGVAEGGRLRRLMNRGIGLRLVLTLGSSMGNFTCKIDPGVWRI
jgi:hypothetical protein